MKKFKKITIYLIVLGAIIALVPNFVSFDKIAAFGLLLIILPFLSLEFLIPSGLLKNFGINDKLPWFASLTHYLIVYPMVNIFFILLLNVFFSFLPEIQRGISVEDDILRKESFIIIIKIAGLMYISLVGLGILTKEILDAKRNSKRL